MSHSDEQGQEDGEVGDGGNSDSGALHNQDSSFGKRKADEFLKRQEATMDVTFRASVVIPGDDVTAKTTRSRRILRVPRGSPLLPPGALKLYESLIISHV